MAITIQNVFATDTISDLVRKVNFNFEQLLLSGGGPRGLQGVQGLQGVAGPTGRRGENIYIDDGTGIGSAPVVNVIIGDNFILGNGDLYEWDGFNWILTGTNIRGPIGLTGPSGASLDFDRYVGGLGSTFPISLSYYPQTPPDPNPTPNAKDFITLKRGGLDILFLGDADAAYGNSGILSGISNMPPQPNSAKLWIVQDDLVGGGKNGLTIGSKSAVTSLDDPNTYANYEQFANLYIGVDGSFNIAMTTSNIEPKPINIASGLKIDLNAGDLINNHLFIGLDSTDNLVGMYGNLVDKIDLTTNNVYFKAKTNVEINVDDDLNGTGYMSVYKVTNPIINSSNQFRTLNILANNIPISNDSNHYSTGLSIIDEVSNDAVKLELFKLGSLKYATLSISNLSDEGRNLVISSNGVTIVSPKVTYPLTPISTWLNDGTNDTLGDGSLSVYRKIRMKNTGGLLNSGLIMGDSNGVFDYVNATTGIPGNSTNFVIGLWGREPSRNRVYPAVLTDMVNLGDRVQDDGTSQLFISTERPGGTYREAKITLLTESVTDIPKIVFKNGFETILRSANNVDNNRQQILPRSSFGGGYLMSFTDNNGQFDDSWEEYQVMVEDTFTPGSVKLKDDLIMNAFGNNTTYINSPTEINKFIISSGVENVPYGTTGLKYEQRFPSKIHLKRINRDFYILNFSICLYIKESEFNAMTYNNFNFFDFTFATKTPGKLTPNRSVNIYDNEGGTWYSGAAYASNFLQFANGDIGSPTNFPDILPIGVNNQRRAIVNNGTEYARLRFNSQNSYLTTWTVGSIGFNKFRIQISCANEIPKNILRQGVVFTGNAIVYGYRDDE